jgi:putative flippase GtrA
MIRDLQRGGAFVLVGFFNTAFGYVSYASMVYLGLPLWLAVACATVVALLFNFVSYGSLIFANTSVRCLPRFVLLYAAIGFVNNCLLQALTEASIGPFLAQALILPLLALLGYCGMKVFVFRGHSEDRSTISVPRSDEGKSDCVRGI